MKSKSKRPMGKERFLNILAERQFAYSFLKRLFIDEPSKEFIDLIIKENLTRAFPVRDQKLIKEGLESVNFYLKDPDVLTDETVNDLRADYVNLFVGPGKLPAPPWESVYRSKKKLIFQDETIEVRQIFAREGLVFSNLHREPDDHIALEMDFLGQMTQRAAKNFRAASYGKVRKDLKTQAKFLREHVLEWAPDFSQNVTKSARTDFYRGVGKILRGYLELDKEQLAELVREVNLRIKLKSA